MQFMVYETTSKLWWIKRWGLMNICEVYEATELFTWRDISMIFNWALFRNNLSQQLLVQFGYFAQVTFHLTLWVHAANGHVDYVFLVTMINENCDHCGVFFRMCDECHSICNGKTMSGNGNGNAVAVGAGIEDCDYEWWWRPCDEIVIPMLMWWWEI